MININDYIKKVQNMQNVTILGSSDCYDFGNVVLIKYTAPAEYKAREREEDVADKANMLRTSGVRTPYHLAIKRETVDNTNICWVLQEKAMGENFREYSARTNENIDTKTQLEKQGVLANAPDSHYEKLVQDLMALFNLGLELKPKNVYYDESIEQGGFTIIDLLGEDAPPFNGSIVDIIKLKHLLNFVGNYTTVDSLSVSPEELELSNEQHNKIILKTFKAMEKVVPNFNDVRRWILRTYSPSVLEYFEHNGVAVGNLTLNDKEQTEFDEKIQKIVTSSIEKLESGEIPYWEAKSNDIYNSVVQNGLGYFWAYHPSNQQKCEDFESGYDFDSKQQSKIIDIVKNIFHDQLKNLALSTNASPNIKQAYRDYLIDNQQIEELIAFNAFS